MSFSTYTPGSLGSSVGWVWTTWLGSRQSLFVAIGHCITCSCFFFFHVYLIPNPGLFQSQFLFRSFFGPNLTVVFLGQFCPWGKGAMRLSLCEASTRETRPDYNTRRALLFSINVWFFNVPC